MITQKGRAAAPTNDQAAVAQEFDQYHHVYDETVNRALIFPGLDVDYFTRVKSDIIIRYASKYFRNNRDISILDLGCGVGNYHSLLKQHFAKITGVDVSEESVNTAAIRNPSLAYLHYDGMQLPFEDGSFDLVFAICVVHHVPPSQWETFHAEMHRVTRKGGVGLIFEHNPTNPLTKRVVNRCPFDRDAVLLRSSTSRDLLKGAGYEQVSSRSILTIPRLGMISNWTDDVLGRLPFGAQYYSQGVRR